MTMPAPFSSFHTDINFTPPRILKIKSGIGVIHSHVKMTEDYSDPLRIIS